MVEWYISFLLISFATVKRKKSEYKRHRLRLSLEISHCLERNKASPDYPNTHSTIFHNSRHFWQFPTFFNIWQKVIWWVQVDRLSMMLIIFATLDSSLLVWWVSTKISETPIQHKFALVLKLELNQHSSITLLPFLWWKLFRIAPNVLCGHIVTLS